jgi:hypothetical protein
MNRCVASVVVSVCSIGSSVAADVTQFQVSGKLASLFMVQSRGCISTNTFLLASDETFKTAGGDASSRRRLFISEFDFDTCAGVEVRSASGSRPLEKFEFSINNSGARLMATIPLTGTLGTEERTVDLTWAPAEAIFNGAYTQKYVGPGYTVLTRFNGTSQNATVTGAMNAAAVNASGGMDVLKSGSVSIDRQ